MSSAKGDPRLERGTGSEVPPLIRGFLLPYWRLVLATALWALFNLCKNVRFMSKPLQHMGGAVDWERYNTLSRTTTL